MKETALHKAARGGHCDIVQRLLDSPRFEAVNALDRFDNTALHAGCLAGIANITCSTCRKSIHHLTRGIRC